MYVHRPDVLSLAFGILFTVLGLVFLLAPIDSAGALDVGLLLGLVAVTAGVGIGGALMFGDVHARAAERLARKRAADQPPTPSDPTIALEPIPILEDPLFGPPVDPDELDRAYRETFGDDDPGAPPAPTS